MHCTHAARDILHTCHAGLGVSGDREDTSDEMGVQGQAVRDEYDRATDHNAGMPRCLSSGVMALLYVPLRILSYIYFEVLLTLNFPRDGTKIPGLGRLPQTPSDYDVSVLRHDTIVYAEADLAAGKYRRKLQNANATRPTCRTRMKSCCPHRAASMSKLVIWPVILVRLDCGAPNFSHRYANFLPKALVSTLLLLSALRMPTTMSGMGLATTAKISTHCGPM